MGLRGVHLASPQILQVDTGGLAHTISEKEFFDQLARANLVFQAVTQSLRRKV